MTRHFESGANARNSGFASVVRIATEVCQPLLTSHTLAGGRLADLRTSRRARAPSEQPPKNKGASESRKQPPSLPDARPSAYAFRCGGIEGLAFSTTLGFPHYPNFPKS